MFGGYIKVKNFVPRLPHYNTMAKRKKKKKRTKNDLQSTTQKTKDRATPIPTKMEYELRCS